MDFFCPPNTSGHLLCFLKFRLLIHVFEFHVSLEKKKKVTFVQTCERGEVWRFGEGGTSKKPI